MFVYIWLRAKEGTFPAGVPYYVGKGIRNRALRKNGPPKRCRILLDCATEQDAFECERVLIKMYGRIDLGTGCLRNLTDGGDGASGRRWTVSDTTRMSAAQKGKTLSPEHRASISAALQGNTYGLGHKHSPEHRAKIAAANIGRKCPDDVRAKIRAANTGHKHSVETLAKMSASKLGRRRKPHSPETRAKMSIAAKRRISAVKI